MCTSPVDSFLDSEDKLGVAEEPDVAGVRIILEELVMSVSWLPDAYDQLAFANIPHPVKHSFAVHL